MRIVPFVLSCRVSGYGIERGVMNHFRQIARLRGVRQIIGRYEATPKNAPCKDFIAEYGFLEKDDLWSFDVDTEPLPSPTWPAITIE
ncbi:MAG: hypothetical protein ACLQJ0_00640 [Steroidobacteraceae bacterium]|jgi:predicted enzyme involved in methoxymalonyl-ACP biosynthesis